LPHFMWSHIFLQNHWIKIERLLFRSYIFDPMYISKFKCRLSNTNLTVPIVWLCQMCDFLSTTNSNVRVNIDNNQSWKLHVGRILLRIEQHC
jgi:hypothetical protein